MFMRRSRALQRFNPHGRLPGGHVVVIEFPVVTAKKESAAAMVDQTGAVIACAYLSLYNRFCATESGLSHFQQQTLVRMEWIVLQVLRRRRSSQRG